ncbi:MAG: ROK family protein [Formosimonas sp.]
MLVILVFDIGGTKIESGVYERSTKVLIETRRDETPNFYLYPFLSRDEIFHELLKVLLSISQDFSNNYQITSVVIAFPAPISKSGEVDVAPTIWGGLKGEKIRLTEIVKEFWPQYETYVLNDVTASGYSCVAKGFTNFTIFTVGSGVGCKVFHNSEPILGENRLGGEIGHFVVSDELYAPICDCGSRGHLASFASGRGLLKVAKNLMHKNSDENGGVVDELLLNNEQLVRAFHQQKKWALDAVSVAALHLGRVIAMLHTSIGMEYFFFMGGMADALGENFLKLIVTHAQSSCWELEKDWADKIYFVDDAKPALSGGGYYAAHISTN